MNKIHYKDIEKKIKDFEVIKSNKTNGNNSVVYTDGDLYYKIWPSDWGRSDIVERAVKNNFYDSYTVPVLTDLIYDEGGQRGYITKKGKPLYDMSINKGYKYWDYIVENTNILQRKDFILKILNNSMSSKLFFIDLCPTNLVLYNDDISLIDLDGCCSFSLLFYGNALKHEKFKKDYSGRRFLDIFRNNVNLFYRDYLRECLDIKYDRNINSEHKIDEIISLVDKIRK